MYPIIRQIKEYIINRRLPPIDPLGTHVSHLRCWPQDIDIYREMNNGRILTILDLGRTGIGQRTGMLRALSQNGWGMTMAGVSVRYRKRIKTWVKFRMVTRAVGWDDKFFYIDQSIWIGDTCAVQALYRSAVTDKNGIVRPGIVFRALGYEGDRPTLPGWVQAWIDADAERPWPPHLDDAASIG